MESYIAWHLKGLLSGYIIQRETGVARDFNIPSLENHMEKRVDNAMEAGMTLVLRTFGFP